MLARSYNDISNKPIIEAELSRLNLDILALRYLEKSTSYIIQVTTKNEDQDTQEPPVTDLEKENKKKHYKKIKVKAGLPLILPLFDFPPLVSMVRLLCQGFLFLCLDFLLPLLCLHLLSLLCLHLLCWCLMRLLLCPLSLR